MESKETCCPSAAAAAAVILVGLFVSLLLPPELSSAKDSAKDITAASSATKAQRAGRIFRDCPRCPEMVVVPAGSFLMGSPPSEADRWDQEGPRHKVTIRRAFAVGRYPVTRDQYLRFSLKTHSHAPDWKYLAYTQTGRDPVVGVGWVDGEAYAAWLSKKTGHQYRLLSEAEYEYAERAGTSTPYWWGNDVNQVCSYANAKGCSHVGTVPVGSYPANAFGLFDMAGNTWEWTADCWNDSYAGAPDDGTAWTTGNCKERPERGGAWYSGQSLLRSAYRSGNDNGPGSDGSISFRLARTL